MFPGVDGGILFGIIGYIFAQGLVDAARELDAGGVSTVETFDSVRGFSRFNQQRDGLPAFRIYLSQDTEHGDGTSGGIRALRRAGREIRENFSSIYLQGSSPNNRRRLLDETLYLVLVSRASISGSSKR